MHSNGYPVCDYLTLSSGWRVKGFLKRSGKRIWDKKAARGGGWFRVG
jgi:hypothetical protein